MKPHPAAPSQRSPPMRHSEARSFLLHHSCRAALAQTRPVGGCARRTTPVIVRRKRGSRGVSRPHNSPALAASSDLRPRLGPVRLSELGRSPDDITALPYRAEAALFSRPTMAAHATWTYSVRGMRRPQAPTARQPGPAGRGGPDHQERRPPLWLAGSLAGPQARCCRAC